MGIYDLKRFELVAATTVFGRPHDGDVLHQGLELVILHAGLRKDLQVDQFVIARFVFIHERVFVQETRQVHVRLVQEVTHSRIGGVAELAEQRSEVYHWFLNEELSIICLD